MKKFIRTNDVEKLNINEVHKLYKKFINPGQVNQISRFGFGNDLVSKAEGHLIFLRNGRKIKDFTGGVGVLNHGHNHPRILEVRKKYGENKKMEVHKNFFNPYLAAVAHNLNLIFNNNLQKSYLCNSGAEAVEGALKIAFKYHDGKRKGVISSDISFHGKLFGSGSISNSPEVKFKWSSPFKNYTYKYDDIESLEKVINKFGDKCFAIIHEPMSASSMRISSDSFLLKLKELSLKFNLILIFDEVYTGWYKTGKVFNFLRVKNLYPDIVTMSKSFGGGKASAAAYSVKESIFNKVYGNLSDSIIHSTTYNGFGEEAATVLESINIGIEENYEGKASKLNELFINNIEKLINKYPEIIDSYSGSGALWGIFFSDNLFGIIPKQILKLTGKSIMKDERFIKKLIVSVIIQEMYNKHGYLLFFGSNYRIPLVISVPINIPEVEINNFFDCLDVTLSNGLNKLLLKFIKNGFL